MANHPASQQGRAAGPQQHGEQAAEGSRRVKDTRVWVGALRQGKEAAKVLPWLLVTVPQGYKLVSEGSLMLAVTLVCKTRRFCSILQVHTSHSLSSCCHKTGLGAD